ncbi:RNA-directed DNA polymerase, eukaryota, reverse transcriptase zinc-binding domain protein [Tanacetum coccineum]|uniref:RNA-directed DNA polymerase, eukaryota, reverse transcriptase zinc-binding domain protein n=1 Tax=Tanacetum coccineum TaxID=301880 RepID=A0ABQ5BI98_9ASTR
MQKRFVSNQAWFMMGDMNVILNPNEHSVGSSYMTSDMNDFKDCVNSIEMEDVVSNGLFYTWTKNLFETKIGDTTGVLKNLDRIMGNEEFIDKFSQSYAIFHPYLISNHGPNVLIILNVIKAKKKAFKFANFVADKKELLPIVKNLWGKEYEGFQMFKTLHEIQTKIDNDPYDKVLRMEESKCIHDYVEAMKDEEKLNHKSMINTITYTMGNLFHEEDVAAQFVKHFQNFLGHVKPVKDFEPCSDLIQKKLTVADANYMVREKTWGIVGGNVCSAIKEFFSTGKILREINSTLISLIPKIATPNKVIDFRPIACCNVIYKCISKIINNRFKGSLGSIVGQYQSDFVPNRHIQDNILLSHELLKGYERKDGPNRVAMKIDIQKAYDTINWKFLEAILKGFGFHEKMVQWIICCISTATFSISVNRESFDDLLMFYHGDKGLVSTLKEAIDEFGTFSSLKPNYDKSTIIFGSVQMKDKQEILECIPFKVEQLPIKNLGVPITSKRIGVSNCRSLIDKIKNKVLNWKNRCLSYAGRLLLIASVLESIHKSCQGAKPKLPGTVFADLKVKEVKWISTVKLKGRSIWAVSEEVNDSWGWKNILKLRDEVRSLIVMKIANEEKASVMYDNFVVLDTDKEDSIMWRSRKGKDMKFSIKQAYQDLSSTNDDVNWYKMVWFSQNIPKYSFILWLAVQNRLVTHYKIKKWGSYDLMIVKVGIKIVNMEWNQTVDSISDMYCGNYIVSIIRRLSIAACVYLIWQERNWRIFRDDKRSTYELFGIFEETIRIRLMSLKVNIGVMWLWRDDVSVVSVSVVSVELGVEDDGDEIIE